MSQTSGVCGLLCAEIIWPLSPCFPKQMQQTRGIPITDGHWINWAIVKAYGHQAVWLVGNPGGGPRELRACMRHRQSAKAPPSPAWQNQTCTQLKLSQGQRWTYGRTGWWLDCLFFPIVFAVLQGSGSLGTIKRGLRSLASGLQSGILPQIEPLDLPDLQCSQTRPVSYKR